MPGPDPSGHDDRQAMDPEVLALVQQAERGIRRLLGDPGDPLGDRGGLGDPPGSPPQPADWDAQIRCLLELQAIAAMLVNAARLHAEHLSRRAGSQIDRPAGA
jgi:hypothetical protein